MKHLGLKDLSNSTGTGPYFYDECRAKYIPIYGTKKPGGHIGIVMKGFGGIPPV
jgi:hypothetical protein